MDTVWVVLDAEGERLTDNVAFTSWVVARDSLKFSYHRMHDVEVVDLYQGSEKDAVVVKYTDDSGNKSQRRFIIKALNIMNKVVHI